MLRNEEIRKIAKEVEEYTIDCRRVIHRFAEVGKEEFKTSAFIRRELEKEGIEIYSVDETGLIAVLDTGKQGPHLALRADMDALPIPETENNLVQKRVCISENPETSHACGHDAHVAMLLGAMKALARNREQVSGVIYACFESGEEIGYGVHNMMKSLAQFPIDSCWAIHVNNELETGKICIDSGVRMAGLVIVDMTVHGKGGHGSRPDLAFNPIFCATSILNNLATAWVNQVDPYEMVTLGITGFDAGDSYNVIPETANVRGTIRYFDKKTGKKAIDIIKTVAKSSADMLGCKVSFTPRIDKLTDTVVNDEECSKMMKVRLSSLLSEDSVVTKKPQFGSESFSHYSNAYPSLYANLGIRNEEFGSGASHHNMYFDIDENALWVGVMATIAYVVQMQERF